ncbi:MAG TPA: VIT1/CCC1 transporter family protein [Polyangiaceae bacterium]|nr:VIT1/CCC1 transporter family protein [Polyangiaceae bacterium]
MHVERHFTGGATVRDVVIGMSDGLTVPFALAAGLSGATFDSRLIVAAGLAEVAAGSIAMGLGGFLAARGEAEHYVSERAREKREVASVPELEEDEIVDIFEKYGLSRHDITPLLAAFHERPSQWVDFMMRFELGLEHPEPGRALKSALVIGASYVAGGVFPLLPYFFLADVRRALVVSGVATLVALFVFGWQKARFTGAPRWRSAWQTAAVGTLAAAAAFALARLVN